ncbi:MAG: hypothetical protein PUP92_17460 [Rhizonema sp. PD38]|nr:hypothetical protein [Rhizonema sp. PD38]
MKITFLPLTQFVAIAIAGISLASFLTPQPSLADPIQATNQENYDSTNRTDPFSRGVEQGNFNVFQLIHNANFGQLNPNYASEQSQELNDAATAFKAKQQQLLQQRPQQQTQQVQQNRVLIRQVDH